jgi:hypothetical protein
MSKSFLKEEIISQLWNAYKKTSEYKSGFNKAIYEDHPLIRTHEKEGLTAIYKTFVTNLSSYKNQKEELKKRSPIRRRTEPRGGWQLVAIIKHFPTGANQEVIIFPFIDANKSRSSLAVAENSFFASS